MLIRLSGHFINNPNHIDKLICINGLPEEWIVRNSIFGGKELLHPWKPDVEANIPSSIRHLCEPMQITVSFPPIEKGREPVVDQITVIGLKFDYMTEPGRDLWDKIERYLERMTPRDQKIPEPCLVAPDQKSPFDPHMGRRSVRGSLELRKCEIPVVDLRKPMAEPLPQIQPLIVSPSTTTTTATTPATVTMTVTPATPVVVEAKIEAPKKEKFSCDQCSKVFGKSNALRMHKMVGHKKKEIVGV